MKDWKKKVQPWFGVLPACIFLVCAGISLSGYEMPSFEVEAAQDLTEEQTKEKTTETATEGNVTISLPPTTERTGPADGASKEVEKQKEAAAYKDGTYYGTGTGFGGELKVKVVIKKGKIKNIAVMESKDGDYYIKAASSLLDEIIKQQSTNVDVVSGATYSSVGLIEAVRDALKDAEVKKEKKKAKATEAATESTEETMPEGTVPYNDGVYYGTGEGYRGDITVAVTICDKTIRYILVVKSEDDEVFFSKAQAILNEILKKQRTDVDVVSGATYSSNGILEAVNNALAEAKRITEGAESPATEKTTEAQATEADNIKENNAVSLIYEDGTYTMEVICNPDDSWDFEPYTLSVTVTIRNDKVISVTDVKGVGAYDSGNDWYVSRAVNGTSKYKGVADQITEKGNAEQIDAVSGATCSSNAVIQAVKEMLEGAKKDKEGQMNE